MASSLKVFLAVAGRGASAALEHLQSVLLDLGCTPVVADPEHADLQMLSDLVTQCDVVVQVIDEDPGTPTPADYEILKLWSVPPIQLVRNLALDAMEAENTPVSAMLTLIWRQGAGLPSAGHDAEWTGRYRSVIGRILEQRDSGCLEDDEHICQISNSRALEEEVRKFILSALEKQKPAEYPPENVQFTVYRPKHLQPRRWRKMLVYAHLDDSATATIAPIEEVRQEAARILGAEAQDYQDITKDSRVRIPREKDISLVPRVEGVRFNPPSRVFTWVEGVPWHQEEFQVTAAPGAGDGRVSGVLTIYLGVLILAEVPLRFEIVTNAAPETNSSQTNLAPVTAAPYRNIFPSYSHRDREIVEQIEAYAAAMGDRYLRDVTTLRAGQDWSQELQNLIRQADVFQLFWSSQSAASQEVAREWRYALSLNRAEFIRPTHWEEPIPNLPSEIAFAHCQKLQIRSSRRSGSMPISGGGGIPSAAYQAPASPPVGAMPPQDGSEAWSQPCAMARAEPCASASRARGRFPWKPVMLIGCMICMLSGALLYQPNQSPPPGSSLPSNGNNTAASTSASSASGGSFLKAKPTKKPGRVTSPYPPYQELDVTGLASGSLALDPKTQKVFEVP